jgi:hypothetical protein
MTLTKASLFSGRPRWIAIVFSAVVACPVGVVQTLFAQRSNDTNLEVVEVSGAGADVESAEKDACREAVRQVVGAYVSAVTQTANDELIEDKVISLSSGFVEKSETLKKSAADGLVRVRIRATVRISKVLDTLRANKISITDVDGQSLGAELLTKNDQRKGEAELIAAAFEGFPSKWFKASVQGKPRLGDRADGAEIPVIVTILVEPDLEAFQASARKLNEALKATERAHGEFEVDGARSGFGRTSQRDASETLRSLVATQALESDWRPETTALMFIDGRTAFPEDLHQSPPRGICRLTFPVSFYGGGKRSTWKWYGMTNKDAVKYLKPVVGRPMTCRTSLRDADGHDIAVDSWEISTAGIGGDSLSDDQPVGIDWYFRTVAIAPAVIPRNGIDGLFQQFTCERRLVLSEDEVRKLSKASISLK